MRVSRDRYIHRGPYPIADLTKALAFEDDAEAEEVCRFYGLIDVMENTTAVAFGKRNLVGMYTHPCFLICWLFLYMFYGNVVVCLSYIADVAVVCSSAEGGAAAHTHVVAADRAQGCGPQDQRNRGGSQVHGGEAGRRRRCVGAFP